MKFVFLGLAAIILLFFLLVFFTDLPLNPLMQVNGSFIWTKDYYGRLSGLEHYNKQTAESLDIEVARRGLLTSLIIDKLISLELTARKADAGWAEKRMAAALNEKEGDLEKAALELYGWGVGDFKKFVLLPQARQDLLAELLQKEGVDFNDWLRQNLMKAEVKIYSLPYEWLNGSFVHK